MGGGMSAATGNAPLTAAQVLTAGGGSYMAIGAVVGTVALSAVLYLIWRRKGNSPKGRPLKTQRNSRQGGERPRVSHANPLLRANDKTSAQVNPLRKKRYTG